MEEEEPPSNQWIQDKMSKAQLLAYKSGVQTEKAKKDIKELVPKEFHKFIPTIFSEHPIGTLSTRKSYDHAIDLVPDFKPYLQKPFQLDIIQKATAKEFVKENLKKGFIRPSKSPQATSLLFVSK